MRQYVPEGSDYNQCMEKTKESLRKYRTRVNDAAKAAATQAKAQAARKK
jgi:hypothetical protein